MRRLTVLLAVMALTLTGCSSTASRSAPTPRVPNVVGRQLRTAGSVLTRSHLDCVSWPHGSTRPFGIVVSESPAAGTAAVDGLTITLNYSVGDDGISVP